MYIVLFFILVFLIFFFIYKDEGVPAFLFHNTPTNFEELLEVIQRSKVHTYTFDEIYDLHLQHLPLKVDSCLLTFDEGYKDNYFIAFPLLKQYKAKATIFINTASIEHNPDYLNWNQIREMYKSGLIDFELNIQFKPNDETFERISEDINLNKELIQLNLNKEAHFFCWPLERRSEFGKRIIRKTGIIGFLSTKKGTNPRKINMGHIQRIEYRNYTVFKFWITLKVCQNLFLGRIYQMLS